MPLVLYTWMATLMPSKDRTENVMIFDRHVHMAAKVAALDDPPQSCSPQLTKQKRSDWARSYHHEVTQRVQAGMDQTRLAQCELRSQFGMPMWVEDEHMGYAHLEVSTAEEPSQHAHEEFADEDLEELGDDDDEPPRTGSDRRSPRKKRTFGHSRLAMHMMTSPGRAKRRSRKSQGPRGQLSRSRRH